MVFAQALATIIGTENNLTRSKLASTTNYITITILGDVSSPQLAKQILEKIINQPIDFVGACQKIFTWLLR